MQQGSSPSWDRPTSKPHGNIERAILKADAEFVTHPSEMPDLLCVATLGTWSKGCDAGRAQAVELAGKHPHPLIIVKGV